MRTHKALDRVAAVNSNGKPCHHLASRATVRIDLIHLTDSPETERLLHWTIQKVTNDRQTLQLNSAVSQLMIFINHASSQEALSRGALDNFVRLLAPFAPHLSEEMWRTLSHTEFVLNAPWLTHDPEKCIEDQVTVVIQINGKLRSHIICGLNTFHCC